MDLSRRGFLVGGAAAFGYAFLGCGLRRERVRGLRLSPEARAVLQTIPVDATGVRFCALGDWGYPNGTLASVVATLRDTGHAQDADFMLLLGDNFYEDGVRSARDRRWTTGFERVFPEDSFDMPFYALLGNHDHNRNVAAQVEYSNESDRWRMPGFYYKASFEHGGEPLLDLFCLDTPPMHVGDKSARNQLLWLKQQLASSRARWRIVAGHHPLLSGGTSGHMAGARDQLAQMLANHRVHAYVSGHDHDLELLAAPEGWLQVVSGSASHPRWVGWTEHSLLASSEPGYVRITATPSDLYLEYVTVDRGPCATFAHSCLDTLSVLAMR